MKKHSRSLLAAALALTILLTALTLGGCAASKSAVSEASSAEAVSADGTEIVSETTAAAAPAGSMTASGSLATDMTGTAAQQTAPDFTKKIIYSASVQLETTDFDAALAAVDKLTADMGGFVENSNVSGDPEYGSDGSRRVVNRTASYRLRVPADRFEAALAQAGGLGNVLSTQRTAVNVTSQFIDSEARLDSLKTQEQRLLAMVEKAADVDTLVALEERLSDVRYQIEDLERTLKNLQTEVDYSTIDLSVREVTVYTPTVTVRRTFGERMADALSDGWHGFGRSMQSLAVFLAGALPVLVLLAALAAAAVLIARGARRRRARRVSPPDTPEKKE